MGNTLYCLCCDEQVPFSTIERNERREVTCAYCGFTLEIQKLWERRSAPGNGCILVAEDSQHTRKMIEDLIREKELSRRVLSFENGLGLTSEYSRLLAGKQSVEIAIVDLNMPVMDGLTAARTMRALEEQNRACRTPVVFFSAEKADENLKLHMRNLEPANYVNKGADLDPDSLKSRVEHLLCYLMEKYRPQSA
jgi:CheY-like chemotaxis protein